MTAVWVFERHYFFNYIVEVADNVFKQTYLRGLSFNQKGGPTQNK